jgi:type IV pilus assembly protein PilB
MRQRLGEMLIEAGAIDEMQLRSALADQRRWGRPLGRTLVEMRLINEDDLVRVLAKQLGIEAVDLDKLQIAPAIISLVPGHIARQHNVIPFNQPMKFIDVAMLDPTNLGIVDELRIRTQLNVRPYLAGPKMIERNLERYYGASMKLSQSIEIPIIHDGLEVKPDTGSSQGVRDGLRTFAHRTTPPPVQKPSLEIASRDREIDALQERISMLEAVVERDEQVLRKLLSLLIEKGIATREEIIERLG